MEYIIICVSVIGIVFGADYLVSGAVSVAKRYKVSDFFIGAAIVGVGTSMPEFIVSFLGAINGNADVAIGNVVGSNIFNILGILGITALFFPVTVDRKNIKFEIPLCIAASVLLALLALDFFNRANASIGHVDGSLLFALFAFYMWHSLTHDKKSVGTGQKTTDGNSPLWVALLKLTGGLALLITSCDFFVDNAVIIAKSFGVNDAYISLTLIACGTSLPELAASLAAAIKKNTDMALGNIIGSNIFNITFILGVCSQVMPLTSSDIVYVDYAIMIIAALFPLIIGLKGKINRTSGIIMIMCFVVYNCYLIINQIN